MTGNAARINGEGRGRAGGSRAGGALIVRSFTASAILAVLAGCCQTSMFPPAGAAWLAWVAPLPIFLIAWTAAPRAALASGWLAGTLGALLVNAPWLWPAMRAVLDLPAPAVALALGLESQIIGGLPFAVLVVLLRAVLALPAAVFVLLAPAAWVAAEYLRAHLPFSAPWDLLGSALSGSGLPIQVADVGGVYAVSYVAALPAAAVARILVAARTGRRTDGVAAGLVGMAALAAALAYGKVRLDAVHASMRSAPRIRVALVHAEVENRARLGAMRAGENIGRHLELGPTEKVDLVVWPENTVDVLLAENPEIVQRIAGRAGPARYLIGAPRLTADGSLRACAFLIGDRGIEGVYDKQRLLPLAETRNLGLFGFTPGGSTAPLAARGTSLGVSICYEAVFPEVARAAVRGGAELLVNLSNDSWFAAASGPRIHFLFGRLRAVETRRALARAANLGVTAALLPDGSLAAESAGRPGATVVDLPLLRDQTIYVRHGDCFAWACVAASLAAALAPFARRVLQGR